MEKEKINEIPEDPASFRDPASRVYVDQDQVVRVINPDYFPNYDQLMNSGLYQELVDRGLLIPHRESFRDSTRVIIFPERVPFITYPYEWSFGHLKEAALVTLCINRLAMQHGMMLKDANAYNIQLYNGHMTLIDTCSFIRYEPGQPWGAYSQFLSNFLCPLLLIKHSNPQEARLLQIFLNGIPVPYTAHRIPFWTKVFSPGIWSHILSQSLNFTVNPKRSVSMSHTVLCTLLDHLERFIFRQEYKPPAGEFLQYAELGSYSREALASKKYIVGEMIKQCPGVDFVDLGSNTGDYSRMAASLGKKVIAVDSYHDCTFSLFDAQGVVPLVVDICNPSPGIGWANRERASFWDRVGTADCVMMLAILHHLCLKNNVPLEMVADLMKDHARSLIIEWVPPGDEKAKQLLGTKQVPLYDHQTFLDAFSRYYVEYSQARILDSERTLYYMERKREYSV